MTAWHLSFDINNFYCINNMSLLFLSFTLGNDIALRSVFDLPCHLFMDVVVDLVRGAGRVYSTLNKNLYFTTFSPRYANFDSFFSNISMGVPLK